MERLEGLGGTYLPVPYRPSATPPDRQGRRLFKMSLARHVPERDIRIDIRITLEVSPGSRNLVQHSYHLGPYAESDEYIIRLCEGPADPHHFHLRGWKKVYQGGHIPANRAEPSPLSRDPLVFLDVVEHFIKTNQIKIQVKK